jgi:hypothetical protein
LRIVATALGDEQITARPRAGTQSQVFGTV